MSEERFEQITQMIFDEDEMLDLVVEFEKGAEEFLKLMLDVTTRLEKTDEILVSLHKRKVAGILTIDRLQFVIAEGDGDMRSPPAAYQLSFIYRKMEQIRAEIALNEARYTHLLGILEKNIPET